MYRALENIGDYKKGEVVPSEKAEVWKKMYLKCPVEFVPDVLNVSEKPVVVSKPVENKVVEKHKLEEAKPKKSLFGKKR